jgi:hypothetical protein
MHTTSKSEENILRKWICTFAYVQSSPVGDNEDDFFNTLMTSFVCRIGWEWFLSLVHQLSENEKI